MIAVDGKFPNVSISVLITASELAFCHALAQFGTVSNLYVVTAIIKCFVMLMAMLIACKKKFCH